MLCPQLTTSDPLQKRQDATHSSDERRSETQAETLNLLAGAYFGFMLFLMEVIRTVKSNLVISFM